MTEQSPDDLTAEEPSDEDLVRMERIQYYVDILSSHVSPLLAAANEESDDAGEELAALAIALTTVTQITLVPFSPADRRSIAAAAIQLFGIFHEQVVDDTH